MNILVKEWRIGMVFIDEGNSEFEGWIASMLCCSLSSGFHHWPMVSSSLITLYVIAYKLLHILILLHDRSSSDLFWWSGNFEARKDIASHFVSNLIHKFVYFPSRKWMADTSRSLWQIFGVQSYCFYQWKVGAKCKVGRSFSCCVVCNILNVHSNNK